MNNIIDVESVKEKLKNPAYIEWEPIIEISNIQIPIFPIEIFPSRIKDFIVSTATFLQVAVEAVAMNFIVIFSSSVGNKFTIIPKEQWEEYLNLFVLIAAAPSERKSPIFKVLTKPLNEALDLENRERLRSITEQNAKIKLLKKQKQDIEDTDLSKVSVERRDELSMQIARLDFETEEIEQHNQNILELFVSDITPEKLAILMENNKGPVSILSSEGAEVFDIMHGRYSGKTNYDIFLKGYSNERVSVNRVRLDKPIVIQLPVLTVGLFVQPSIISNLPENILNRGLMQRFLFCFPKSLAGHRDINSPTIPQDERIYYEETMKNLFLYCVKGEKIQLRFSRNAIDKFNLLREENEKLHLEENRSDVFKQWVGKLDGQLARLTGLLHIMNHLDEMDNMPLLVSEATVKRAILLKDYIMINAEKAFGILEYTEVSKETNYVLKKIKHKYGEYSEIPYQKLWQDVSGKLKKSKVLRDILKYLEEMNYVKLEKDMSNHNKEMIFIHPDLVKLVKD